VVKKRTKKSSLQLVDEFVDEGVPENEPRIGDEEADLQKAVEESLNEFHPARQGPLPPVVIREPESGKCQPLSEDQGKDQFIFQRRTSTPTESFGHDESSSLYAELGLTYSESESDEEVPGIDAKIVPAFMKELIYRVLGLQVLFLELNRFGILLGEHEEGQITSSGWPFVSIVLGQMAHLVASITLDSSRSYMMQSEFLTQGTVSSIPIIFSWSDSIRPEGFLSFVLLWLVIIIAVVGVGVMVVVVVESYYVVKLSFVIT
ncbi:retrovirus-related pol polyprotein from transposon TNT 1-94, partial [Tanacetum coccineum]